jgi:hypothetical protein
MTSFMEPSDIKPGDQVVSRVLVAGRAHTPTMDVVSVTAGFATCRWIGVDPSRLSKDGTEIILQRYPIPKFNIFHTSDLVVVARQEGLRS